MTQHQIAVSSAIMSDRAVRVASLCSAVGTASSHTDEMSNGARHAHTLRPPLDKFRSRPASNSKPAPEFRLDRNGNEKQDGPVMTGPSV